LTSPAEACFHTALTLQVCLTMPRRRTSQKGFGPQDGGDGGAWGEMFTKTKMCKFIEDGQCIRGKDCAFAHQPEELKPLPNLRRTKMCRAFRLSGFCEKAASCSFAHSEEEMRTSLATSNMMPQQDLTPPHGRRFSGDLGRLPDWIASTGDSSTDLSSMELGVCQFTVKGGKKASASEDIWSRQTSAQAASCWSRQTTQDEDPRRWSRQTSDDWDFEASAAFKLEGLPTWHAPMSSFPEGTGSLVDESCGDASSNHTHKDEDLELQVHNTFLAALPRRRSHRRALTWPTKDEPFRGSPQEDQFSSY